MTKCNDETMNDEEYFDQQSEDIGLIFPSGDDNIPVTLLGSHVMTHHLPPPPAHRPWQQAHPHPVFYQELMFQYFVHGAVV